MGRQQGCCHRKTIFGAIVTRFYAVWSLDVKYWSHNDQKYAVFRLIFVGNGLTDYRMTKSDGYLPEIGPKVVTANIFRLHQWPKTGGSCHCDQKKTTLVTSAFYRCPRSQLPPGLIEMRQISSLCEYFHGIRKRAPFSFNWQISPDILQYTQMMFFIQRRNA